MAENYFANALAWADSLKKHLTCDAAIEIWVLDSSKPISKTDGVNILDVREFVPNWENLALKYSVLEYCTALKPNIISHYFESLAKDEIVVYLDPDIYFYSDIGEILFSKLQGKDYALVQHCKTPLPDDGKHPNDKDILMSGTFNLGFIAIKNSNCSKELVFWWKNWLENECWADPKSGVFTDQKWIDLAVCYWPNYSIIDEPGFNVAYWNLHERVLTVQGGRYLCNNKPLVFFHFSGFNPKKKILSKYENRLFNPDKGTALYDICEEYRKILLNFDYDYYNRKILNYLLSPGGHRTDAVVRSAYRRYLENRDFGDFWVWLSKRNEDGFTNYEQSLLERRSDVMEYVASFGQKSSEKLKEWILSSGISEERIDLGLLREIGVLEKYGVTYCGYFSSVSGVSDAASAHSHALELSCKVEVSRVDLSYTTDLPKKSVDVITNEASSSELKEIAIIHANADVTDLLIGKVYDLFTRYTIGFWAWELETFPEKFKDSSKFYNEIWVPSTFVKKSIENVVDDKPIYVIHHPVEIRHDLLPRKIIFSKLNIRDIFTFMISFDASSGIQRKNPESAIAAFVSEFSNNKSVQLIVKYNGSDDVREDVVKLTTGYENVIVIDKILPERDYMSLLSAVDCYVSLHRSEGFGFNIAYAMAVGTPVIVTAYGGNMDFCTEHNCYLVPYTLCRVGCTWHDYRADYLWADADTVAAAKAMKNVYANYGNAIKKAKSAQEDIRSSFSEREICKKMENRILQISKIIESATVVSKKIFLNGEQNKNPLVQSLAGLLDVSVDEFIKGIYRVLFGREADQQGYDNYRDLLSEDDSRERRLDIIWDFMKSKEFSDKLGKVPFLCEKKKNKLLSIFYSNL